MSDTWARVGYAARPRFNACNEATKHLIMVTPTSTDRVRTRCGMSYRLSDVDDARRIDRPCARCERYQVGPR